MAPPEPEDHDEGAPEGDNPEPEHHVDFGESVSAGPNSAVIGRSLYDLLSNVRNPRHTTSGRKPDPFDGKDETKLNTFFLQLGIYFRTNPDAFTTESDKVHFALSYLKGTALEYFEPEMFAIDTEGEPDWLNDYQEFVSELRANFGPYDEVGDAEAKLSKLRMDENKRVTDYLTEFNRLATKLDWGDSALRFAFYNGLAPRLKDDITHHGKPDNLRSMKKLAQTYDARHWERRGETSRRGNPASSNNNSAQTKGNTTPKSNTASATQASSSSSSNNSNNRNTSASAPQRQNNASAKASSSNAASSKPKSDLSSKLDKNGKLTTQERERRIKAGLCLFCGQSGHMARECPRSAAARARAAQLGSSDAPPSAEQPKE